MSLRALKLTGFNLLSSADDLNLSIISIADLRLQTHRLVSLVDDDLVRALISGSIWVSRGIYYRFDIQISFNGNVLYGKIRNSVLESLGSCIRDGHVSTRSSCSGLLLIP
jgi:hypothetical protein